MDTEPKDVIVLGSIRRGKKKFSNIQNETRISPEELNSILEQLENNGFIRVEEKKGWFGKKIELKITDKGSEDLDKKIVEIQNKWKEMQSIYESGDKQKLQQKMEENKSFLPTMMFFGVMDMMMFSMMFSMMGIGMSNFVAPENMPAESMDDGGMDDGGMDDGGMDDGGFDFDIGF
ncbi:winged helix-turn-helix transcriptional regulator [Nitrosopumilus sp. Nsub]|uniref:winged helix-turn-helix transcriptional regulator n=1 Tax=Nitrosopumilus sp. Nsub TaxID=1776294 RepID=UPI0008334E08|nr:winged helix-turn-helix transcriptional regulator [Nitrosopumilus sp. Nsub]